MILLRNHKRTGFGKPHAYRGPMCSSEKSQWCGEPCFAGAAISISGRGVGVLLAADSQSTSKSGYRASIWDPWPDFILLFFLLLTITFFFFPSKAPSLTRKRVCSLQCNHSLVRAVTPNNHTLPSHLRLCSLFVASYDSQGLRWKYSNPPLHG
jgi:hypothetical protein